MTLQPAAALLSAAVIGFGVSHAQYVAAPKTDALPPEAPDYGYPAFRDRPAGSYADTPTYREPRHEPYGNPYDGLPPGEDPSYDRNRYGNAPVDAYRNRANPRQAYEDRYGESHWNGDSGFPRTDPYLRPDAYGPDAGGPTWRYPDHRQPPPPSPEWGHEDWTRDPYARYPSESPAWERPEPYATDPYAYREQPYRRDARRYGDPRANAETPYANRPPSYANPNRFPAYPSNPPYAAGDPWYGYGAPTYPGSAPGYGFAPGAGYYPGLAPDYDSHYWNIPGIGDMRFPGNFGNQPYDFSPF